MRKIIAAVVAVMVMALPSVALAAAPEVLYDGSDGYSGEVPAGEFCEFAMHLDETVEVRVTLFKDKDGNPVKQRVHVVGQSIWSTDDGAVEEHWAISETYNFATDSITVTGNRWNGHTPGQGSVINGSGRIHVDFATDEMTLNGPSQDVDGDFEAFCAVLAP